MKCNNCGSILLVGTTVCPYCNTPQEGVSNETTAPVASAEQTTMEPLQTASEPVVSATPTFTNETPIMDNQNVGTNLVGMGTPTVETTAPAVEQQVAPATPVEMASPVVEQPAVEPVAPVQPVEPVAQVAPQMTAVEPVNDDPYGTKVASSLPEKKKKKTGLLILAIILVIVIGCGIFFYFYEFKSADKRIDSIFNYLTKGTSNISNEKIEKRSGKYSIDGNVYVADQKMGINIDGTYGIDINNKILDFTTSINKVDLGESLIPEALKLGVYVNDNKGYLSIPNFFNKMISEEIPGMDEYFNSLKENDVNYTLIINGMKNALAAGTKAMDNSQGIEKITLDGKKSTANVITIKLNSSNFTKFRNGFVNSLKANDLLLEEIAKISEVNVADLKKNLEESLSEPVDLEIDKMSIKIASPLFGNDLLGIKLEEEGNTDTSLELVTIDNGFKLLFNTTEAKFELSITSKEEKTSSTTKVTDSINGSVSVAGQSISFDLTIKAEEDNTPKVEKRNVKDSISASEMTQEDLNTILNNISSFGQIGELFKEILGSSFGEGYGSIDDNYDSDFDTDLGDLDLDTDLNFDLDYNVEMPTIDIPTV